MSIFTCKMCGGSLEVDTGKSVATCKFCGTKQTLPKLSDDKRANMYERANHFRRANEFDKAMAIYEQILNDDSTDAEAYWSIVLCRYGIEYVEDPESKRHVPTVNRVQYTSILADEDYRSALEYADAQQKSLYEAEAKEIEAIQKGILSISQKEEPFDVFICYKETDQNGRRTPDSVLAQDLYYGLKNEGFKVFFSRITLEDKLGSAYEPYIFAALNSAKVMVVLGTKPEYFNAVWVKNEWNRYLALIKQGKKKMLIPAYKDMDPYDLPAEFSHLQAQDMSKLGFMQDLIRGVKKIVGKEKKDSAEATGNANASTQEGDLSPLIKRIFFFLEDGDWESADEYCEKVLDRDPENAQAYLGKLMVDLRVKKTVDLKNLAVPFDNNPNYKKVMRFADEKLKASLAQVIAYIKGPHENDRLEAIYQKAGYAMSCKDYEEAANLFYSIRDYKDAANMADICLKMSGKSRVDAQKKPEVKAPTAEPKSKNNKKVGAIVISILALVVAFAIVLFTLILPEDSSLSQPIIPGETSTLDSSGTSDPTPDSKPDPDPDPDPDPNPDPTPSLEFVLLPDGSYELSNGLNASDVVIPSSYEGKAVTSIGSYAFDSCTNLTSITIPDSVTAMGLCAFYGCSNLRDIYFTGSEAEWNAISKSSADIPASATLHFAEGASDSNPNFQFALLPDGTYEVSKGTATDAAILQIPSTYLGKAVTSIAKQAFINCTSLTSITIPSSVTSIGDSAFYYCTNLTSITISDSVKNIGASAFYYCSRLPSITLPNGVEVIRDDTFSGCSNLTSITIPASVTSIASSAFENCGRLSDIYFTGNAAQWNTIDKSDTDIPSGAMVHFGDANTDFTPGLSFTLLPDHTYEVSQGTATNVANILLPSTYNGKAVTSIGANAFRNCTNLTSITIPSSITSIGEYAFDGCSSLFSIVIPNSVKSIGTYAFRSCSSLTGMNIPDSVTSVGSYAFRECTNLASVTLSKNLTKIEAYTFYKCNALGSVEIPNGVTEIGSYAFYYCKNLTSVTIPDSVEKISDCAFSGCSGFTSITIPASVTTIADHAFYNCRNLTDIYFLGTEDQWNAISKSAAEIPVGVVVHYN